MIEVYSTWVPGPYDRGLLHMWVSGPYDRGLLHMWVPGPYDRGLLHMWVLGPHAYEALLELIKQSDDLQIFQTQNPFLFSLL